MRVEKIQSLYETIRTLGKPLDEEKQVVNEEDEHENDREYLKDEHPAIKSGFEDLHHHTLGIPYEKSRVLINPKDEQLPKHLQADMDKHGKRFDVTHPKAGSYYTGVHGSIEGHPFVQGNWGNRGEAAYFPTHFRVKPEHADWWKQKYGVDHF